MPTEPTGTVDRYEGDHYVIRLGRLLDGSRPYVHMKPGPRSKYAEQRAAELAVERTKEARDLKLTGADFSIRPRRPTEAATIAGPSMGGWVDAWTEHRRRRGLSTADTAVRVWHQHIEPVIGGHVRDWTREDLRALSRDLDAKVHASTLSWKTAQNVWGVATKMVADAASSKIDAIRVRADNLTGVEGPERGERKGKQYLWPSEFRALISSSTVPVRWRRLFVLAVYTYVRAGELAALEWDDVDLEHCTIHVHRALDRARDELKSTKSGVARRIPIERELLPLLRVLHAKAAAGLPPGERPKGRVFHMPSHGVLSGKLKFYLRKAGVERQDLFVTDATRKALTFHDLRATGITWCAARGDEPLRISQRAGHSDFQTTQIYIREAENLQSGFGEVFPPLPASMLGDGTPLAGGTGPGGGDADLEEGSAPEPGAAILVKTARIGESAAVRFPSAPRGNGLFLGVS